MLETKLKIQGEFKKWRDSGELYVHYWIEDGKRHGECKYWYAGGAILDHSWYEDSELHGEYKWWHEDGTLGLKFLYHKGQKIKTYV